MNKPVIILISLDSTVGGKVSGRGTRAPAKVSLSLADNHQNGVMSNPMYGDPGLIGENGDTLRNLPNPFYNYGRVNSNMADNPLYRDHPSQPPAAQQGDNIYSVPRDSPTASPERGGEGGVRYYSVPKSPAVEAGEVYSYATVGATGGGGDADSMPIEGPRYATPAGGSSTDTQDSLWVLLACPLSHYMHDKHNVGSSHECTKFLWVTWCAFLLRNLSKIWPNTVFSVGSRVDEVGSVFGNYHRSENKFFPKTAIIYSGNLSFSSNSNLQPYNCCM